MGWAVSFNGDLSASGPDSALLLERRLRLEPGQSRTLYFAYGYLPGGFELNALVDKYRKDVSTLWERSSVRWKEDGLRLQVESEPWVERETSWHNYYLRSGLTYDDFFQEHIISQGGYYQYLTGGQYEGNDGLQHALPFVFSRPESAKEVLRYNLKTIQPNGDYPYGIVGHGTLIPWRVITGDQELWLLLLASEYVLGTRDTAFLDEEISTYPVYGPKAGKETVRHLLGRCYRYLVDNVGTGEHGLIRLLNADWWDDIGGWAILAGCPVGAPIPGAESVLN
jgi:cellobiose phosphorylase